MIIIVELVKYINSVRIEIQHQIVTLMHITSHYLPTSVYFLYHSVFFDYFKQHQVTLFTHLYALFSFGLFFEQLKFT